MSKFAANLTMLFTEQPFLERFAAAREAGFSAVEFLFPYEWPAAELGRRLREQGLSQALGRSRLTLLAKDGLRPLQALSDRVLSLWLMLPRTTVEPCLAGRSASPRRKNTVSAPRWISGVSLLRMPHRLKADCKPLPTCSSAWRRLHLVGRPLQPGALPLDMDCHR